MYGFSGCEADADVTFLIVVIIARARGVQGGVSDGTEKKNAYDDGFIVIFTIFLITETFAGQHRSTRQNGPADFERSAPTGDDENPEEFPTFSLPCSHPPRDESRVPVVNQARRVVPPP